MNRRLFLDTVIPHGLIELRALSGGRVVGRLFTRSRNAVDRFCDRLAGAELYLGAVPRDEFGDPVAPRVLWADVDFKDTPEAEARERLALMDAEPHVVVRSGGGLHCYWLMSGEAPRAKTALRALARLVGGDLRSAEPAHILRLPDTLNHKYSPPRPVKVERLRPGVWTFDELLGRDRLDDAEIDESRARAYAGPTGGDAARAAAVAWLADRAPAVEGRGGDDWTYKTCAHLARDLGLSEDDAMTALASWNRTCLPPWDERDLRAKVRGAMKYGRGEVGAADPAEDFKNVVDMTTSPLAEKPETLMEKMSRWFKAVDEDGKLRVFAERHDDTLKRKYWVRYTKRDFLEVTRSVMHLPDVAVGVTTKGDTRYAPAGVAYLDHYTKKTTYRGLVFAPEHVGAKTPDGKLNLWQGYAVEPRPEGTWNYLKELLLETLCDMDARSYEYVLDWLARAAQRPWEPGGTALVFRGSKGTGKGTLGRAFVKMFGQHGMHVTSQALLTGRFNIHLRDVVALFADEAFWAGDKAGEGVLKGLITEPTIAYEGKGTNVETGRNCVHMIMASNEDWVVPAGMDKERRFAVFQVADERRDKRYWDALHDELAGGGLARMLHDLLARDVSGFDPHAVPRTSALAEQKMRTMSVVCAWLYDAAENEWEDLGDTHDGLYLTDDVHRSYLRHCDRHGVRAQRASSTALGIALRKHLPVFEKRRVRVPGSAQGKNNQRYFYRLPTPSEALEHLDDMLGLERMSEARRAEQAP